MALIRTSPPNGLTLYAAHPTPPDILDRVAWDFALAAHQGYNSVVQLVIDSRQDFLDLSPENVLQVLKREQGDEEVWSSFCCAPILWANLSIANIPIPETWPRPYDPFTVPPSAYDTNCDWRLRPPELAYVLVAPEACEVLDSAEGDGIFLLNSGGRREGVRFYRLINEWATRLRLERNWHPGCPFRKANAKNGEWEKLMALGLRQEDEDKVVSSAQRWVWTAPKV
ncbi:hypothetical protein QFC20_006115 [Naganishia adeliensis]|uniref:Uncharacterized protein n=1 Tax=Naganishia adeliensis TaxID=92952 RepID=A0ACC2VFK0_9TREE|nr:hypothetical protein QFC20_006115 [Naganishia adeliensis]